MPIFLGRVTEPGGASGGGRSGWGNPSMVRHVHFRRGEEKALAERSAIGMPIATPVIAKCIDLLHLCTVMLPEAGGRVPDATAGRIPPGIEVSPGR